MEAEMTEIPKHGVRVIDGVIYLEQFEFLGRVRKAVKISDASFINYRKNHVFEADRIEHRYGLNRDFPLYLPESVEPIIEKIKKEKEHRNYLRTKR